MTRETQNSQNLSRKWQWLVFALVILSSFACVFISAQGALMRKQERVISANMLAAATVSYQLDPEKESIFAPLDVNVIIEATYDAGNLERTPASESVKTTPIRVAALPPTTTPKPNTPVKALPTDTPEDAATQAVPSDTPVLPTETEIPPTSTELPPTATKTATSTATIAPTNTATKVPPVPTQTPTEKPTKKPKKPTQTPVPPTATPSPTPSSTQTSTSTPTFTWTPVPTNTPTSTLTPSDTPVIPPTDTPIPTPTFTPTPVYLSIRPLLTCVEDNGDGTFTAHFGYNNRNAYDVDIPIGNRNRLFPGNDDQGQPTHFTPGRHDSVFSVEFVLGRIWVLDDRVRIAGPDDNCP